MIEREFYVIECGYCNGLFAVGTMLRHGQYVHSQDKGGCGHKTRATFTGGMSASVKEGPFERRWEAMGAIHVRTMNQDEEVLL